MGSESSKSTQNSNSNGNAQRRKIKTAGGEGEDERAETAAIRQEMENKINEIESSLKTDTSRPNLVAQFANILELEGVGKMDCVTRIVHTMGEEWKNLMKEEDQLFRAVGSDEMQKLKNTRSEYFCLLLETKKVVVGLIEQSKIQKENVQDSLNVINKAVRNGDARLSKAERLMYDESMKHLFRWVDQRELVAITAQWRNLCEKMEAQKSRFHELFKKYKSKRTWTRVAICFGIVIGVAAVIGLIIATSGAAAAIAAVGAKTTAIFGIKVLTAHLVTAGIAVGAGLLTVSGGLCYGYYVKPNEMAEKIQQITAMLEQYIKKGREIQSGINEMGCSNKQIKEILNFDYEACLKMRRSLYKIDRYLDDYVTEGKVLVVTIEKACIEFIGDE